MGEAEMRDILTRAIAEVPNAVGMNNHTGSKFTQDAEALGVFFPLLRETSLFFVDSRTTGKSKAYEKALEAGIRAGSSSLFLDNRGDPDAIVQQGRKLIGLAKSKGTAIGICHFRPTTAGVLGQIIQEIRAAGVELVHVSELIP